jgi:hypothetical protein
LEQKLTAFIFTKRFRVLLDEIRPAIQLISRASTELKQSRLFAELLQVFSLLIRNFSFADCLAQIVLSLGNFMNGGSFRGNAGGIALESLNILAETKSPQNGRITLLHFLCKLLEERFEHVLQLPAEIGSVGAASKVSSNQIQTNLEEIKRGMKIVESELQLLAEKTNDELEFADSNFVVVMKRFVDESRSIVEEEENQWTNVQRQFVEVCEFFGEDSQQLPEDMFALINKFVVNMSSIRRAPTKANKMDNVIASLQTDAIRLRRASMRVAKK